MRKIKGNADKTSRQFYSHSMVNKQSIVSSKKWTWMQNHLCAIAFSINCFGLKTFISWAGSGSQNISWLTSPLQLPALLSLPPHPSVFFILNISFSESKSEFPRFPLVTILRLRPPSWRTLLVCGMIF